MSLITLRPVREVGNLQSVLDQFFNDRFFSPFFKDAERSLDDEGWSPAVDIYETSDELAYTVELPGFEKDQIKISGPKPHIAISVASHIGVRIGVFVEK